MIAAELLERWGTELSGLTLVNSGDRNSDATDNMVAFSLADAQDAGVESLALASFLLDAFRLSSRAAARLGHEGFFYAWHDEQAGQLRMSAAWVSSTADLPFRATLHLIDEPEPIAEEAIESDAAHGIPLDDSPDGAEPDESARPPLTVFARPLIRTG